MAIDSKALVERALSILKATQDESRINHDLVTWVQAVQKYGREVAVRRQSKLNSKFGDWLVPEAIDVIAEDNEHWKTSAEKVEAIASIISERMPKKEVREIATHAHAA